MERQLVCPTGQQTGREREGSVFAEHYFTAQTQERSLGTRSGKKKLRWLTGHIKRVDWPRLGQTNLLKMRAVTGHSLCDSGQSTPPV